MQPIDWAIVAALLALVTAGAAATRRHANTVSAFLAAERCGGRYLIAVADNMSRLGVITLVWFFEQNYEIGFTGIWWTLMEEPAMIVMALSGWVIYRFRQTRAMTLAEFFERRYSRRFRVFAGLVAFLAGIINFGVFPSVGARFFIALWDLPAEFGLAGLMVPTYAALMFALLAGPLMLIFIGGQLSVMVTDFLQGVTTNLAFLVLIVFLLVTFSWSNIGDVLLAAPPGKSLVHPFDTADEENFNILYFVISVVTIFYGARAWQGTQGYNCSAINAHEAQMSFILGQWRFRVQMLIVIVLPVCIRTFLSHADFAAAAAPVHEAIGAIGDPAMQNQLRSPLAMRAMFPTGLLGLASVPMLGALVATHGTYMHSWGAILTQDVILPFFRRPLTPQRHLIMLKLAMLGTAVFAFCFSLVFQHTQYIAMYLSLTGAVFVGGAGSCIIGGLYWKRGTTQAAWAAMLTGMTLAMAGILIKQLPIGRLQALQAWPVIGWLGDAATYLRDTLTGQEMNFIAMAASVLAYVLVSLLGPRRVFNLDRLLHRGAFAIAGETSTSIAEARTFWEKMGLSRDFTGRDRIVTYITLSWPLVWTVIFVAVTWYNLVVDVPAESWLAYWRVWTWFILAAGTIVTIWLTIGGTMDLRKLFRLLRTRVADARDDGRVINDGQAEGGFPVLSDRRDR